MKRSKQFNGFTDKEKPHYSLRKLNIGVISVLVGTTLYFMSPNAQTVKADTIPNDPTEVEQQKETRPENVTNAENAANKTIKPVQPKADAVKTQNAAAKLAAPKVKTTTAKAKAVPTRTAPTKAKLATFKATKKGKKAKVVQAKSKTKKKTQKTKSYKDIASPAPEQVNNANTTATGADKVEQSANNSNGATGSITDNVPTSTANDSNTNSSNASDSKPADITNGSNETENSTGSNASDNLNSNSSDPTDITNNGSDDANAVSEGSDKQNNKKPSKLQGKAVTLDNNGYINYSYNADTKTLNFYDTNVPQILGAHLFTKLDVYKNDANKIVFNNKIKLYGQARNLFENWSNVTEIKGLNNVDTTDITDMFKMFYNCTSLKSLELSNFDTSNVTNMQYMFSNCNSLTSLDLSNFNTSNVTDMMSMFDNCTSLKSLDLSSFDTSNTTDMAWMFYSCFALEAINLSNFNTSNVTSMAYMFNSCHSLAELDLSNFDTSNVDNMREMFYYCQSLESLDVSSFNTSKVTDMNEMFDYCLVLKSLNVSGFNTSKVTDMRDMFSNCSTLKSLDVSNFDTSKVTDMSSMFNYCKSLESLDVSRFNTSNVTSMYNMFAYCSTLKSLDVSSFNTSKVINIFAMFDHCESLTSLDLSSFDTSKVTSLNNMFNFCSALKSLNVSNFDTSKVTSMYDMFYYCKSLESLDVSSFDTSNVTDMTGMLYRLDDLKTLHLGNKFKFADNMSFDTPGTWLNVGNGTIDNPQATKRFTSDDLVKSYDPTKDADTYVLTSAKNVKSVTDTRKVPFGVRYVKTNTNIRLAPDVVHYWKVTRTNLIDADTGKVITYGTYYIDPNQDIPTIIPPEIAGYSHNTKSITKDDWIQGYGDHGYVAYSFLIYYDLLDGYTETKSDQRTGNFGVHFVEAGSNDKKVAPDVINQFNIYHIKTTDSSGKVVNTSPWIIDDSQTIPTVTIPTVDGYNRPFWNTNVNGHKNGEIVKGDLLANYNGLYPDSSLYLGYTKQGNDITRTETENTTGTFKVSYVKRNDKNAQLAPDAPVRQFKLHRTNVINDATGEVITQGKWQIDEDQDIPTIDVPVVNGYIAMWNKISKDSLMQDFSGDSTDLHMYMLYDPMGKIIPVDKNGNVIAIAPSKTYLNDPNNAAQVLGNQKVPTIPDMTPQTPTITPKNGAQDTKVVYYDNNKTTINFLDKDNDSKAIDGVKSLTGSYDIKKEITKPAGVDDIVKQLQAKGYELVTDPFADKVIASDGEQAINYIFKHKIDQNYTEVITGKRIIHFVDDKGTKLRDDYVESVNMNHVGAKDLVTGKITWLNDDVDGANLNPYYIPIIQGYIADLDNDNLMVGKDNKVLTPIQQLKIKNPKLEYSVVYHKVGNFIPVDSQGNQLKGIDPIPYANDKVNAAEIDKTQSVPTISGYKGKDKAISDPLVDTKVIYLKNNKTVIGFIDQDNGSQAISGIDPIETTANIGEPVVKPDKVKDILADLDKKGYELVKDPFGDSLIANEGEQAINYIFKHKVKNASQATGWTQTIHFVDQDGNELTANNVQIIAATRVGKQDLVTNKITWEDWTFGQKVEDVNVPVIKGYLADKKIVPASKVTLGTDADIKVVYHKLGAIVPVDANGNAISSLKPVTYENDPNDPTKILASQKVPEIAGYQRAQTEVMPKDPLKDTNVVYKALNNTQINFIDQDNDNKAIDGIDPIKLASVIGDKVEKPTSVADIVKQLQAKGYELVTDPFKDDVTATKGDQAINYIFKHGTKTETETVERQQTVHFADKDGKKLADDDTQIVKFNRENTTDLVTKKVTYGTWKAATNATDVTVPVVKGYLADQAVVKANVNPDKDTETTVTYQKLGSIVPVDAKGNPIADLKPVIYENDPKDPTKILASQKVPSIPGYRVDQDTVTPKDPLKNTNVVYKALNNTQINFIDQDDNNQAISGVDPIKEANVIGDKVEKPASVAEIVKQLQAKGYELVTDPFKDGVAAIKGNQAINYIFKHGTKTETETVERKQTVHFVDKDGNKLAEDNVQNAKFSRENTTDLVTKKVTHGEWTIVNAAKDVKVPVVKGYLASQANVKSQVTVDQDFETKVTYQKLGSYIIVDIDGNTLGKVGYDNDPDDASKAKLVLPDIPGYVTPKVPDPSDLTQDTKVIYHAQTSQMQVVVHDDDTNKDLPDYAWSSGKVNVGDKVGYDWSKVKEQLTNAGYEIVKEPTIPDKYGEKPETITIHVKHKTIDFDPDNPPKDNGTVKWPSVDQYKQTHKRVIHLVDESGRVIGTDITQEVTFKRKLKVDGVTGAILNPDAPWIPESETYPEIKVPSIPGYTAKSKTKSGLEIKNGKLPSTKAGMTDIADSIIYYRNSTTGGDITGPIIDNPINSSDGSNGSNGSDSSNPSNNSDPTDADKHKKKPHKTNKHQGQHGSGNHGQANGSNAGNVGSVAGEKVNGNISLGQNETLPMANIDASKAAKTAQSQLPQTGRDEKDNLAIIGLAASLIGLTLFGGFRRKKEE